MDHGHGEGKVGNYWQYLGGEVELFWGGGGGGGGS